MNQLEITTNNIKRAYILIGSTIGLIFAGLSPAVVFGYSLTHALIQMGWNVYVAIVAGGSLSITLEVIGGVSAYVALNAVSQRTRVLGYTILGVYTIIGLGYMLLADSTPILRQTGIIAYLVAPLVYFAVALFQQTSLQQTDKQLERTNLQKQRQDDRDRIEKMEQDKLAFERQQAELKLKMEHEERLEKLRMDAEVKKSKNTVAGDVATLVASLQEKTQQRNVAKQPTKKQQAMMQHFTPGITPTELAKLANVDKSTASRFIGNGAMKHWESNNLPN